MIPVDLLYTLFDAVVAPLHLVIQPGNFPLQDITVGLFAVVANFFVTVGARVDVGLLRTDVAPGHDGVGVRVWQLTFRNKIASVLLNFFKQG